MAALTAVAARLKDDLRIDARTLAEMPFQLPDEAEKVRSLVALAVESLARELILLIIKQRSALREIEWRDLERVIATAFEGIGSHVELTPPAKDGGKDIVLTCSENGIRRQYVVEIKHWVSGKQVGRSHARRGENSARPRSAVATRMRGGPRFGPHRGNLSLDAMPPASSPAVSMGRLLGYEPECEDARRFGEPGADDQRTPGSWSACPPTIAVSSAGDRASEARSG
ncbi:MAG: restriction endonuclease [Myxococcota bacterium]